MTHRLASTFLICLGLLLAAGCCTTENRASKKAALQTALILEAESAYVVDTLDPRARATAEDGTFDKEACVEHSKMLELFRQDNIALAAAWRAWANDEDVPETTLEEVDHEARCAP